MTRLIGAAAAAAGAVALTGALGVVLARRVVMPRRPKYVRAIRATDTTLTLEAARDTTHPGRFGVWLTDGTGHALIGRVLDHDATAGTVTREILDTTTNDLRNAERVRWTGHIYPDHLALHPDAAEVPVPVDGGTAPAWLIPGFRDNPTGTWAIHVHGIRTTRITALRTVPAAQQLGYTSLVISYRGDSEGPPVRGGASMLGQTEWHDIDSAITYARQHGASSIVLFGWSMGASPALLVTERSPQRDLVAALVLISPVTDWNGAIRAGAARAHLPRALGSLAAAFLTSRSLSRLAGLPGPIDIAELSWTSEARLVTPCLVIHSNGDTEIPVQLSRRFAAANSHAVDLVEIDGAAHAWEYNLAPDRFTSTITGWLTSRAPR
jgi:hypothetical protein